LTLRQNMMTTGTNRIRDYSATGKTSDGAIFSASVSRLSRLTAVIEIQDPKVVLRASQIITEFAVNLDEAGVYNGQATVGGMVNTGAGLTCELKLAETGFVEGSPVRLEPGGMTAPHFDLFLDQWQKVYRILPEFKVIMADTQMFLLDMRQWLNQVELEMTGGASTNDAEAGLARLRELSSGITPAFNALHERFEEVGRSIEPELRPAHELMTKRLLHPLVMCSPFAHRTFHKPLGYAGDYEMVNMMLRDPLEGNTYYAKALNAWFINQWPAEAHRNRITYLVDRLREESLRGERRKRPIRVLNLGCGPAHEVVEYLKRYDLTEYLDLTLWDFNDETVRQTGQHLEECKRRYHRTMPIKITRKSVHQVLKDGGRNSRAAVAHEFDYIYCAGLFDYLTNRTCKQLDNVFYDWLAPGGLLAVTNVVDYMPFRHMMEFLLDWKLIYRDTNDAPSLYPDRAPRDCCRVLRDVTGVNMMVEVRKPTHA
jgi:extracellular factor (EF) 3-hydroxypalmitic acid methyl ester biosynthesis protein